MAAQATGEGHAESAVSEPKEGPTEPCKAPWKLLLERVPWEVLGRWDPREINTEELDAAILEHAKQAFMASEIPKLHFVKSTDKDLGGWKRKDHYVMRKDKVCCRYICPLAYRSKCPSNKCRFGEDKFSRCRDAQQRSCKGSQVAEERVYSSSCLGPAMTTGVPLARRRCRRQQQAKLRP